MKVLMTVTLIFFATFAMAASDDQPIGLISMVKGSVQIQHAGSKSPVQAKMADLVGPGDHLITGAGGEAIFLYCPDSRSARLPASGEVTFTNAALQVNKGKLADERKIAGCRLPSTLALSASSQQQVGLMKTRGLELSLHSPSQGVMIATPQPDFRWTPVKDAVKYEVTVRDREENTLYKATVTGTEVAYPASAPKLQPGQKYWWRVTAIGTEDKLVDAGDFFRTMPEDKAREFKASEADLKKQIAASPQDNGPRILLAFLYEDNGMYDAAACTYDALDRQAAGNPTWIKSQLNTMLNKLGWDKADCGSRR